MGLHENAASLKAEWSSRTTGACFGPPSSAELSGGEDAIFLEHALGRHSLRASLGCAPTGNTCVVSPATPERPRHVKLALFFASFSTSATNSGP